MTGPDDASGSRLRGEVPAGDLCPDWYRDALLYLRERVPCCLHAIGQTGVINKHKATLLSLVKSVEHLRDRQERKGTGHG